jgi:type IV secretory pathway VirB9-like protein
MYSIRTIGLIGVLAGAVLGQAQQLTTVTATPADVKPAVTDLPVSGNSVTDLHLRPLFTTTIRLPEPVTSVAVGAPTLFEVEHSDQEPRLVFVKPSTKESATSNMVIALRSGQELSMRLLSGGDGGNTRVDFVVNYRPPQSFLIGSTDAAVDSVEAARG